MKFNVEDHVKIYGTVAACGQLQPTTYTLCNGAFGIVREISMGGQLKVAMKADIGWLQVYAHPKQCRKLVKKPLRHVWIDKVALNDRLWPDNRMRALAKLDVSDTAPAVEHEYQWVEFKEVRRTKK